MEGRKMEGVTGEVRMEGIKEDAGEEIRVE